MSGSSSFLTDTRIQPASVAAHENKPLLHTINGNKKQDRTLNQLLDREIRAVLFLFCRLTAHRSPQRAEMKGFKMSTRTSTITSSGSPSWETLHLWVSVPVEHLPRDAWPWHPLRPIALVNVYGNCAKPRQGICSWKLKLFKVVFNVAHIFCRKLWRKHTHLKLHFSNSCIIPPNKKKKKSSVDCILIMWQISTKVVYIAIAIYSCLFYVA